MTIIWHSSTEGGVHHHTLSCFLTALVNWLSVLPHGSISKNVILDSLLTALAALDGLRSGPMSNDTNKFRLWDDESIWQLAVDSARSDLIIVCQSQNSKPLLSFSDLSCYFQQPLLQASSLLLQTIVCATHWLVQRHGSTWEMPHFSSYRIISSGMTNHLRWLFLPWYPMHFCFCCSVHIRGLVSSSFRRLMSRRIDQNHSVQFILSSPWTKNFCADLRNLLSGDNISEYSSILAARISSVGTILLDEVSL